ncbi:hypothetical protein A2303_06470 [Candidatus Falkowbacteria bacterium RIFOXYB2_FULL_47_14]|uniref:Uncharacterized protein n=1 Tax=Candidatus Falkowbacteria bacterium RIFOXYA2_FULL_47_19 TaxID=1797994 RepID=A0A1F5SE20_9BACT|nr:MAG: hypothetical protein A2227_04535 [Candidatus Falkowbacteria bacterium RIFOXYA2_FULL_47_19]OGF35668.1 MAG: hypothetical protein A2468_04435 [Candidatus Falkowbacteria bacterium RIFOXYC2_FULL_46_15]OGF43183.1 MAG: hypothetical protein A2303_06470 [Candidatus Falkowbacteria bacterium RIFOXYB2_FULL_47_14]
MSRFDKNRTALVFRRAVLFLGRACPHPRPLSLACGGAGEGSLHETSYYSSLARGEAGGEGWGEGNGEARSENDKNIVFNLKKYLKLAIKLYINLFVFKPQKW